MWKAEMIRKRIATTVVSERSRNNHTEGVIASTMVWMTPKVITETVGFHPCEMTGKRTTREDDGRC